MHYDIFQSITRLQTVLLLSIHCKHQFRILQYIILAYTEFFKLFNQNSPKKNRNARILEMCLHGGEIPQLCKNYLLTDCHPLRVEPTFAKVNVGRKEIFSWLRDLRFRIDSNGFGSLDTHKDQATLLSVFCRRAPRNFSGPCST